MVAIFPFFPDELKIRVEKLKLRGERGCLPSISRRPLGFRIIWPEE